VNSLLKLLQMEILALEPWFKDHYHVNVNLAPYINSSNVIAALKHTIEQLLSSSHAAHQDVAGHTNRNVGASTTILTPIKASKSPNESTEKSLWPSSPPTDTGMMSASYPFTPEQSALQMNGSHEKWTSSSKASKVLPSSKKDILRLQAEILREVSTLLEYNDELYMLCIVCLEEEVCESARGAQRSARLARAAGSRVIRHP
jgi:hypothetical protein